MQNGERDKPSGTWLAMKMVSIRRSLTRVPSGAWICAITVLTWPIRGIRPTAGLDPSWQAAMHLGAQVGFLAGRDLVFTYGPLGFLAAPALWWTPTAALAFVWTIALWAALATTLFVLLQRITTKPLAALGTWALLALAQIATGEVAVLLVFLWCLACAHGTFRFLPRARLLVSAAAVLAGVSVLVKLNGGIAALALVFVTAWVLPPGGLRSVVRIGGLAVFGLVMGWFATGGSLLALGPFFLNSFQIVSGYTEAMAINQAPPVGYLLFVVLLMAYGSLLWIQTTPDRRLHVVAVSAVAVVMFWKQSFVRYDYVHGPGFFLLVTLAPLALGRPINRLAQSLFRFIVVLGLFSMFVAGAPFAKWPHLIREPSEAVSQAMDEIRVLTSSDRRSETVRDARAAVLRETGLDDLPASELAGHSVHVDPYEVSAVWALGLDWRPVPVFQSYFAYTPELDDLNARVLASASAPERVLRLARSEAIDGRNRVWDSPAYTVALLCNYRKIAASPTWEVLAHRQNRCGRARKLMETDAASGAQLQVPVGHEGEMVFARIGLRRSTVRRVFESLVRPLSTPEVVLDGSDVYRLIPATSEQPLLLRVPAAWGFSPDFETPLERNSLAVRHAGSRVRVEFWAVSLEDAG